MPRVLVVEPIVARLTSVDGVLGLHDQADQFDYACALARGDAIDRLLLLVIEERGWGLFDDSVLDRVSVEHDGKKRARILVDGKPATPWWHDRIATSDGEVTWHFESE